MRSARGPLVRYVLALGAWTLAGEALLANRAVQAAVVLPFARWQGALVEHYLLAAPLTVSVDPSCSGLEVIALCMAATLAYPVAWSKRLSGAAIGVALLLALNLIRIAMLAGASQSEWFQTFHVNIWPTLLVVAASGWVLLWIRTADGPTQPPSAATRRFVGWAIAMLGIYVLAVSILTDMHVLDHAARGAAHMAASLLATLGADVTVTQQVLRVGEMQYLITPECVTTPLIAFYFAALFAYPIDRRARWIGVLASVPLFGALAVLRLLTVALPVAVAGTTLILTHGFNQILTGVAVLVAAALWWRGERSRARALAVALLVSAVAIAISAAAGLAYAAAWSHLLQSLHLAASPGLTPVIGDDDGQGALVVLPMFQLALFAGACVIAWPPASRARWAAAGGALIVSQFLFLALLGWMHAAGIRPFSALAIRGWAVIVPVVLLLYAGRRGGTRPAPALARVPA